MRRLDAMKIGVLQMFKSSKMETCLANAPNEERFQINAPNGRAKLSRSYYALVRVYQNWENFLTERNVSRNTGKIFFALPWCG
jgi:hypothetical protein